MVKVYAPASSANMSVGFDVLGAAVTPVDGALLGDVVTVEAAETFSLNNLGPISCRQNLGKISFISVGSVFARSWVSKFQWRWPWKRICRSARA